MAKEEDQEKRLVSERITRNKTVGRDGWEISSDFVTREYENEDCDYTETEAEHMECPDGTVVNAAEMFRSKTQGGVTLRRCDACVEKAHSFFALLLRRDRAVNVYSPAETSRRCFTHTCRKSLCERHYVLSKDKHIRCRRCDFYFRLKRFVVEKIVRPVFFKRVQP
ncbi:hypothetical protein ACFL5Z_09605 [Planctomycetota bacterium]